VREIFDIVWESPSPFVHTALTPDEKESAVIFFFRGQISNSSCSQRFLFSLLNTPCCQIRIPILADCMYSLVTQLILEHVGMYMAVNLANSTITVAIEQSCLGFMKPAIPTIT
jgi:hypothetical protein